MCDCYDFLFISPTGVTKPTSIIYMLKLTSKPLSLLMALIEVNLERALTKRLLPSEINYLVHLVPFMFFEDFDLVNINVSLKNYC